MKDKKKYKIDTQKPAKYMSLYMPKISQKYAKETDIIRNWSFQGTQLDGSKKVVWKGPFNHIAFCTFDF